MLSDNASNLLAMTGSNGIAARTKGSSSMPSSEVKLFVNGNPTSILNVFNPTSVPIAANSCVAVRFIGKHCFIELHGS